MRKQEHFLSEGHRSKKDIKVPFGIDTFPHLHIKSSLYVCWRVQGFQIFKQSGIIMICSKVNSSDLGFLSSGGGGGWVEQVGGDIWGEQL